MNDFAQLVECFGERSVLIIGDTIIDEYVYGSALGISSETPTVVARLTDSKVSLGGAFLVTRNLLELGAQVEFVTLVGDDPQSEVIRAFDHPRLTLSPITEAGRATTVKTRYWIDGYKLLQFDQLYDGGISDSTADKLVSDIGGRAGDFDAIVVADNRHGLLTPYLIGKLMMARRDHNWPPTYIDSQVSQKASNHLLYGGALVICLNEREACSVAPGFLERASEPSVYCELATKLDVEYLVVKRGVHGVVGWLGGAHYAVPAIDVAAKDPSGAGDAFLAALCLAGVDRPVDALKLANAWAGLSTLIHGTEPPQRSDLLARLGSGGAGR